MWTGQGYTVTLYRGAYCPCVTASAGTIPDPGQGNPNCTQCGGNAFFYPDPPQQIQALIANVESNKELVAAGMAQPGSLVLSPLPGSVHINDYDLVLLPWTFGVPSQGQLITRGSGSTDKAWYRMMEVTGAWTVDPVTFVKTEYKPTVDFTWNGRVITWVGNQPSQGSVYSIRYTAKFEWLAFTAPQPRFAWGQDLGQRCVMRKRHEILPAAPDIIES